MTYLVMSVTQRLPGSCDMGIINVNDVSAQSVISVL